MPHFHTASPQSFQLPFKSGVYEFVLQVRHTSNPHQSLILVRYKDYEFFIRESVKQTTIYKCEKGTKIEPIGIIKDALMILQSRAKGVLSHNLSPNTPKQLVSSVFLLSHQQTYAFVCQREKPLSIEVGFGSGRHLLELAKNNPNEQFLGLEIHTPSVGQVLRQIEILGLKNLFVSYVDARIVLQITPKACVKNIYVHFPVPWKKHHRRVITRTFLLNALRILQPLDSNEVCGYLHLRTDEKEYLTYTIHLLLELQHTHFLVEKNTPICVVSKYEARWRKQEKDIYDCKIFAPRVCIESTNMSAYKNPAFMEVKSQKTLKNGDFTFCKNSSIVMCNIERLLLSLALPKIIKEDYFLHINALYKNDDCYVVSLCLGDFDEPQNAFVLIQRQGLRYLNAPPLPTQSTIKAHQLLRDILESKDKH